MNHPTNPFGNRDSLNVNRTRLGGLWSSTSRNDSQENSFASDPFERSYNSIGNHTHFSLNAPETPFKHVNPVYDSSPNKDYEGDSEMNDEPTPPSPGSILPPLPRVTRRPAAEFKNAPTTPTRRSGRFSSPLSSTTKPANAIRARYLGDGDVMMGNGTQSSPFPQHRQDFGQGKYDYSSPFGSQSANAAEKSKKRGRDEPLFQQDNGKRLRFA